MGLRVAALVKQVPRFEAMTLGPDGRLVREGLELEMNPYCRRAVAQGTALVAEHGGALTVVTLGPPSAQDCLREALAWAGERGVEARGVLVTDPAFAGSDTLATARALAAALDRLGPFDLVLLGRNSVDADTGQVGPQLAELTGLPFLTGVRGLRVGPAAGIDDDPAGRGGGLSTGRVLEARCEHDDGFVEARVHLPAVLSVAERLIDPCKVDPDRRADVPAGLIARLDAPTLGPGPWGAAASPTRVGPVRVLEAERQRLRWPGLPIPDQVGRAIAALAARGALDGSPVGTEPDPVPATPGTAARTIGVAVEPDRATLTRELLGAAAGLGTRVVALWADADADPDPTALGGWGADEVVVLQGARVEEDVAVGVVAWSRTEGPWALLGPSTAWGREVLGRVAAALGAGLTGDAVGLEARDDELVAAKPAFGGRLVAEITCTSRPQMATVRPGVLPRRPPRARTAVRRSLTVTPRRRVEVLGRTRDDDLDVLADAPVVLGVGQGVPPDEYPALEDLRRLLGAELGATRKVTDRGWLPRARQIGITGRSVSPRLFVSIGASGRFNHLVGVRAAGTVLAVNHDPDAPVHDAADVSIVGDWRVVVRELATALARSPSVTAAPGAGA